MAQTRCRISFPACNSHPVKLRNAQRGDDKHTITRIRCVPEFLRDKTGHTMAGPDSHPVSLGQTQIFKHPGELRTDAKLAADAKPGQGGKPGKGAKPVELVLGSQPDLSTELNTLLKNRLRQASLVLSAAYTIFFIKNLLVPPTFSVGHQGYWLWSMAVAGVITGIIAWRLCAKCHHVLDNLRRTESIVFLTSATYLFFAGFQSLKYSQEAGMIPAMALPWVVLIFTYALFIPNTWQRALLRIVPLALTPLLSVGLIELFHPEVRAALHAQQPYPDFLMETVLIVLLAGAVAVWGIKSIGSLRTEAFQSRQMGQYRLKNLLGRGGMGEVYLAEHVMLKRPCAIKIIRPTRAGDPQALARFEKEVQSMARLTHWNTVEIFDYGRTDDGTFYYVMEYLPGENLDDLITEHGPMPASRIIHLISQVCDALAEAHAAGLIHRDIKPGNIFAAVRGGQYDVAKLLDFGLVRDVDQTADEKLTQEKMVTGSPLYLSPEQARGDVADQRSDLYSLGCVMHYLLTGRPPFEETHPVKLILAHAQQIPARPSTLIDNVPEDLERVIMRCMEKDPRARYASVRDLRLALLDCEDVQDWTSETAHDWWNNYGCPRKKEFDRCVCEGVEYESHAGNVEETADALAAVH